MMQLMNIRIGLGAARIRTRIGDLVHNLRKGCSCQLLYLEDDGCVCRNLASVCTSSGNAQRSEAIT